MASIEASLERASAALAQPTLEQIRLCQSELESAAGWILEVQDFIAETPRSVPPEMVSRLRRIHAKSEAVQALIRQASAFYRSMEQAGDGYVLGYTPHGLERAL